MASLQLTSKGEPDTGVDLPDTTTHSSPVPSPPPSLSNPLSPVAAARPAHHLLSSTDPPSLVFSPSTTTRPSPPRASEPRTQRSLGRSNRFAPYLGATPGTHLRRSSIDVISADARSRELAERASSSSPPVHHNALPDVNINVIPPRVPVGESEIEIESDVPISSFVRRRTPQSSPTAPTFPHRKRSSSQTSFSPVMLPTLPPGFPPSPPPNIADDMDLSEMEDSVSVQPHDVPKPRTRRQGLRLSSYRDHALLHGPAKAPISLPSVAGGTVPI